MLASIFVGFGLLWLSLLVALRTGSAEAGLRAFLVQGGILAGLPAGALGAFAANELFSWGGRGGAVGIGAVAGALIGALFGLGFDLALRQLRAVLAVRRARAGVNAP